jgi:hypothetical protein
VQNIVADSRRAVEEMLRALEDHVGQREEMVQSSCFTGPEETGMVLTKRVTNGMDYGLIDHKDTKTKCRRLNKLTCKVTLRQVFICLRKPPPHLGYVWGGD